MQLSSNELLQSLIASIEDNLRIPRGQINPDATLETIAIDSITFAEVVVEMERKIGRTVPPEVLDQIQETTSVRELAALIASS